MYIRSDKRWGPVEEQTVASFEARNRIELPVDYRAFLLAHHGGVPDPSFYWVVPDDWGSSIESLYGFSENGYRLQEYLDARDSIGVAPDMLVIGDDGCGSFLSIGILGPRRGQVFYIDHEFSVREPQRERFLACGFKRFTDQLCVGPDY